MKLLAALGVALVCCGCLNDAEVHVDRNSEIRMIVSAETRIIYDLFDADRTHPMACMLVMEEDGDGAWHEMPFGAIEGFSYEPGHEYELRVRRTILADPPLDGSDRRYVLLGILLDRQVSGPEQEKEIVTEADIEYYDLCPIEKYGAEPEIRVTADGKWYHFDGTAMPSYDSAFIYVENILDKADPQWAKFNSTSYMWIYTFVISPLAGQVRTVRNAANHLQLKEVIPVEEMQYIVDRLPSGEELHYAFVAANVHKYGLQRLEITVRKI